MDKKYILTLVIVASVATFYFWPKNLNAPGIKTGILPDSPFNATYIIQGKEVTLKDGVSEENSAPGSASKITTRYFGNEISLDLNNDGRDDSVFLLTQETGGSGVFYYVVAALNTEYGYIGSRALFLGDRISPQTTARGKGNIVVINYAERKPSESFAVSPSVGKSIWLLFVPKNMQFGEVAQNFEGEADPARMTLGMKKWIWISTMYSDGKNITPRKEKAFTLMFRDNGAFGATTDCNGTGGKYTVSGNKIILSEMISTLMYCEGSQEREFTKMLGEINTYHFTSKGELVFDLKYDSGVMVLR